MTICLGLLGLALLARPAMAADNCVAPPGTSGIDQYCEALPSPGGNSHHGSKGGGASGGSKLPSATKRALARQGAVGAAVLAISRQGDVQSAQAGVQTPARRTGGSKKHPATHSRPTHSRTTHHEAAAPANIPAAPASNPVSAVGNSVSVGGGLVAALLATGAVLALLAWVGWRRRSSAGPA